jgi:hypothetical protein
MLQDKKIDYRLLASACEFYEARGYEQIEVPWVISPDISIMTSPTGTLRGAFVLSDGRTLVCSAEHGFVDKTLKDELVPDKFYYSVSPCFRDEILDATHSKWFMKLELFFVTKKPLASGYAVLQMVKDAYSFFSYSGVNNVKKEATEIGIDLMAGDLEIGSYGTRVIGDYTIAYGTGAALPRLSVAKGDI